ncbi:MAG: two-component regulator propeller domain-containing protein, partial [Bryobacteraceae bacterium]
MKKLGILLFLCGAVAFGLDPNRTLTQYLHRIWQQGLPPGTIYSILQTSDGYLWLGTQTGLVRFDGVRFTPPIEGHPGGTDPDILGSVWVRALLEDASRNLWVGTNDSGLLRVRHGVVTHYGQKQGLPSATVHCLTPGKGGALWVCTAGGLAELADGKMQVYRSAQGLASDNVRAVCQAGDGTLWAGGESPRLSAWNGSKFVSHLIASASGYTSVRALVCSHDGSLWIGTTNGLIHSSAGRERVFTVHDGLPDKWVVSLQQSRDGSLWIGTKDGFSRWRNGEIESFRSKDGLSQSAVYSVYEDREGSLWVGTKHGLNQFVDGRAIPYTASEGLPSNNTGPVLQDRNGVVWVGTLDAGLARFNGRRFTALTTKNGLASNTIRALAEDTRGDLWAGTDAGLNRLHDGRVESTYTARDGLPANAIRCLFLDRSGALWAGTAAGPARYSGGKFLPAAGTHGAAVLAFGQDAHGQILAATDAGFVYVLADGKFTGFTQGGLPPREVVSFYEDPDGLVWMGTLGAGLRLLENGKVFNFYMHDGLFDDEIYGVVADGHDRLWMACSKGIFSVNRSDLRKFAAGAIPRFTSTPYIPTDALRTIECQSGVQPAAWRMQDGRLWFSTIRGLIVLDPNHLHPKLAPPPVEIEEITVNGENETVSQIDRLAPGRKNLEFRYTGLSFVTPSHLTFRYILEGFDKNWIDAGTRREAFYT